MVRTKNLVMRINHEERAMLSNLAQRLQRSRADTIRLLIREAVRSLDTTQPQPTAPQPTPAETSHVKA